MEFSIHDKYIMLQVSPTEAAALIASLADQLKNNDPNSGRLESQIYNGDLKGYFSIAIVQEQSCVCCGKPLNNDEIYKFQKQGLLCQCHQTQKEIGEDERNERLDKSFAKHKMNNDR